LKTRLSCAAAVAAKTHTSSTTKIERCLISQVFALAQEGE
jgi:hypothetical protein